MRGYAASGLLVFTLAMANCTASQPQVTDSEDSRRPLVQPFEELCPTEDEYDATASNTTYVEEDFDCDHIWNTDCANAYFAANKAEEALCNAHRHYLIATSFDKTDPTNIPTTDERLLSLRSSLYFLRSALYYISKGFWSWNLYAANENYQRYLAQELAEAASLADAFAMDGADLAMGISDSLGGTYGSFRDLQRRVWGRLRGDGTVAEPGVRGAAYTFLYGLPGGGPHRG
jgi:hypothetical protein